MPLAGTLVVVTCADGKARAGVVALDERLPERPTALCIEVFGLLYKHPERIAWFDRGEGAPSTWRVR